VSALYKAFYLLTQLTTVNTQDIRKDLGELREGLKRIRQELNDYYTDLALGDGFSNQMWTFVGKATSRLEYLVDDVNHAETTFTEVVKYFGEDEKNMTSTEFFAVFKTFVTSYKVSCPSTLAQRRDLARFAEM